MKKLLLPLAITFIVIITAALGQTPASHAVDALAFVQQHAPEVHSRLLQLQTTDDMDYRSALDEASQAAADHAKILATGDTAAAAAFVKMYVIDFRAISVSDKLVSATDEAEKAQLRIDLQKLIAQSFDQWIIVEQARIQRMERELAALKADFLKAQHEREKVIESDTDKLIEESRAYQQQKAKQAPAK